jgi:hypothetical protein
MKRHIITSTLAIITIIIAVDLLNAFSAVLWLRIITLLVIAGGFMAIELLVYDKGFHKPAGGVDYFRRTVEDTCRIAVELGFQPQVSPNESNSGSALYHADPDGNFIKLLDLEIPASNSTEADFMELLESNRERLVDIAKKFKDIQEKKNEA